MEWLKWGYDLFVHLDKHLGEIVNQYGAWTYLILVLIIFCETGLVVTPFLPGDSLLFAAGAVAALGSLNVGWLLRGCSSAAAVPAIRSTTGSGTTSARGRSAARCAS